MVDQVRSGVLSATGGAGKADALPLTRKGNDQLVTTRATANKREAVSENATGQEAVEFALDHRRHLATAAAELLNEPNAVTLNSAMQRIRLNGAGPTAARRRRARLGGT